jgi:hypothetical protein
MKNGILLENYYLPGALQAEIEAFVEQYHHRHYHESLNNLTPAVVNIGRGRPSCWNACASSAKPSSTAAWCITKTQPNFNTRWARYSATKSGNWSQII